MINGYTRFNDEILQRWSIRGITHIIIIPLDQVFKNQFGDETAFQIKPYTNIGGHLYNLSSEEVYSFADNDIDGIIFMVHENDLSLSLSPSN